MMRTVAVASLLLLFGCGEFSALPPAKEAVEWRHRVAAKLRTEGVCQLTDISLSLGALEDGTVIKAMLHGAEMPCAILDETGRSQLIEALKRSPRLAQIARDSGFAASSRPLVDLTHKDIEGVSGLEARFSYSASASTSEVTQHVVLVLYDASGAKATVVCEPNHVDELIMALEAMP